MKISLIKIMKSIDSNTYHYQHTRNALIEASGLEYFEDGGFWLEFVEPENKTKDLFDIEWVKSKFTAVNTAYDHVTGADCTELYI